MVEKKSSKKKTAKKKTSKKEVCENFEIKKDNKKESVTTCGNLEEKHANKKDLENQNKTLRNILIALALMVIIFVGIIFSFKSMSKFTYENTKFELTKEGELLFYKTSIPVLYDGETRDYNFYLRKNPKKIADIEFDGEIKLLKNIVVNMSEEIKCDGDETIALVNLVNLWKIMGANIIKDENATCDPQGRYIYWNIIPGEKTKIVEKNPACYDIIVNNCEVLEVTEKLMLETFVEINKIK